MIIIILIFVCLYIHVKAVMHWLLAVNVEHCVCTAENVSFFKSPVIVRTELVINIIISYYPDALHKFIDHSREPSTVSQTHTQAY
jgi:hypothetical protein